MASISVASLQTASAALALTKFLSLAAEGSAIRPRPLRTSIFVASLPGDMELTHQEKIAIVWNVAMGVPLRLFYDLES